MLSILTKEEDELQEGWDSVKYEQQTKGNDMETLNELDDAQNNLVMVRAASADIRKTEHIDTCDRRDESRAMAYELREFLLLLQKEPAKNATAINEGWDTIRFLFLTIEQFEKVSSETHCRICREVFRDRARSHLQAADGVKVQLKEHIKHYHKEAVQS